MRQTSWDKALAAQQNKNKHKARANCSGNGIECWYCGKTDDVKAECFKWKCEKSKNDRSENNNKEKALVAGTRRDKQPTKLPHSISHKALHRFRYPCARNEGCVGQYR